MMIGSAVGFFGGLYVLYGKLKSVNSAVQAASLASDSSPESVLQGEKNEEEDGKKARNKKPKTGFRERRVNGTFNMFNFFFNIIIVNNSTA